MVSHGVGTGCSRVSSVLLARVWSLLLVTEGMKKQLVASCLEACTAPVCAAVPRGFLPALQGPADSPAMAVLPPCKASLREFPLLDCCSASTRLEMFAKCRVLDARRDGPASAQ